LGPFKTPVTEVACYERVLTNGNQVICSCSSSVVPKLGVNYPVDNMRFVGGQWGIETTMFYIMSDHCEILRAKRQSLITLNDLGYGSNKIGHHCSS